MRPEEQPEGWVHPCDLCGSLEYEPASEEDERLRRCHVCGLIQLPGETERPSSIRTIDQRTFNAIVRRLVGRHRNERPFRVLVIGPLRERTRRILEDSSILLEHLSGSIDSGGYPPETFDIILCTRSLDSVNSIGSLFAHARTWLRPLGLFVTGSANWESVERRLWTSRWLRNHPDGRQYPGYSQLKAYATRYGFEVVTSGTTVSLGSIARTGFGSGSGPLRLLALPIGVLGWLPRLGSSCWGVLVKRGLATRPVLDRAAEEVAPSTGLAAAGYMPTTHVRREGSNEPHLRN